MTPDQPSTSPKSPRNFYPSHLAAAWMRAHHGFEITNRNGVLLANLGIGLVLDYANHEHLPLVYHPSGEPCFIILESLPLLELQIDDF